ncbi:DUF1707 SHOCT-like domain-containing protein [Nigerium massiliense]|uniref:DUF1707 SHOCT-like domain-containing protein n=1 Tax=Nigerium massiliense TaxID=1522317 RepID=UPI00058ACD4F|nr:DUF1707 domain-containing protein [Nigerium massiliense]
MSDQPLPAQRPAGGDLWSRFTADPRTATTVRASYADRDVASEVINQAYADGRLDQTEHGERLERALAVRQLGEFPPLLEDILPARTSSAVVPTPEAEPEPARRWSLRDGAVRSWIALAILFNLIWLASWAFSGHAPYYYWPIWPMIGTAIPVVLAWASGVSSEQRDADRRERRELRRGR